MKQILSILAISLVMYSCQTKRPDITLPETSISAGRAWDSLKLSYNTFYRLVLNRAGTIDSSAAVVFFSNGQLTEYKVSTDTNGLHLNDSSTYASGTTYSEYQQADPNYYASSVGYIFTMHNPIGGTTNSFPLHDCMVTDTFTLRIGTPIKYYSATGKLRRPTTDTTISVTLYR
jgi:hypothetical protein